jgi:hypothetical protein
LELGEEVDLPPLPGLPRSCVARLGQQKFNVGRGPYVSLTIVSGIGKTVAANGGRLVLRRAAVQSRSGGAASLAGSAAAAHSLYMVPIRGLQNFGSTAVQVVGEASRRGCSGFTAELGHNPTSLTTAIQPDSSRMEPHGICRRSNSGG